MKIALIGSRSFPIAKCAPQVAQFISEFPKGTVFLTRASEGFDLFAGECAKLLGYDVDEFPGKGGAFNFERDVNIAREADKVVAFFAPEAIGQGGTQHVIDKALDQRKPVESWTVGNGALVLCGSDDGEDQRGDGLEEALRASLTAREGSPERPGEEVAQHRRAIAFPNPGSGRPDRGPELSSEDDQIVF